MWRPVSGGSWNTTLACGWLRQPVHSGKLTPTGWTSVPWTVMGAAGRFGGGRKLAGLSKSAGMRGGTKERLGAATYDPGPGSPSRSGTGVLRPEVTDEATVGSGDATLEADDDMEDM